MAQEDSLKRRYSLKLLSNIIGAIVGMALVAVVPKALGPTFYGYFSYLQQFFNQLISFLEAGTSIAFFTKISARHDRKELFAFYAILVSLLASILALTVFFVNYFGFNEQLFDGIAYHYVYLGVIFSFLTWVMQLFIKISDAYALTVSVEILKTTHKILSFLLLIYIVNSTNFDLTKYFYFQYLVIIIFLAISTYIFIKKDVFERGMFTLQIKFKKILREFLDFCTPIVVYSSIGIGVSLFDVWSLQYIGGSEEVGFYSLALAIVSATFLFTSAITPLITREFSKYYEQGDFNKIRRMFSRYVPMLYSITAYFAVFISFQSEVLINLFTDERFESTIPVLTILAFYSIHQVYGQIGGGLLYASNQVKLLRNINIVGSAIGIVTTVIFVYILDTEASVGFATKMLVWQFLHVNIMLYFNSKFLHMSFFKYLYHQIYVIILFVALAYFSTLITYVDSVIYNFLITGAIYTALVALFSYWFPVIFATTRDEINKQYNFFKGKINGKN